METTIEKKNPTLRKTDILSDIVIKDFITGRKKKSLKDLKGKISFKDDYNYKLLRS